MYKTPRAHVDDLLERFNIPLLRYTELLPEVELFRIALNAHFGEVTGKDRGMGMQKFLEFTSMAIVAKPNSGLDLDMVPLIAVHPCIAEKGVPFKHSGQYAVLLHEIGHLRHPTGHINDDVEREGKEMLEEMSAWEWALDHAVPEFWTPECTTAVILGFESRMHLINTGNWPQIAGLVERAKRLENSVAIAAWTV